ncbi:MAG: amidohydrolase family protein [Dehalococcoidia bacterium]|nr:amidohydrolase family protein [Dehalococcoidia bacterium]
MPDRLLVRGGRVIDPGSGVDRLADVLVEDGRIGAIDAGLAAGGAKVIEAGGLVVAPGFIDLHTHLREPGYEYKETIESGTRAAARGGFTTVCCMPNTDPALDSKASVDYVLSRAAESGVIRVLPIGCVTKGRAGKLLAELGELAAAGCIGFSDDGSPVADAAIMRRALEYASTFGLPVIDHCEDPQLAGGVMHEGWVSTRLGLKGIPAASEESAIARDLALARQTGAHVHIAHISTAGGVELVRRAKADGARVTSEVTPHHLSLTHEAVMRREGFEALAYDTNAKMYPPLRRTEDVEACIEGLRDGTIDAIATDHAPHAVQEKLCEFDDAAFGIVGLETAFGLAMSAVRVTSNKQQVTSGTGLTLERVIEALTIGPVRALALDRKIEGLGTLAAGSPADIVLLDPEGEWTVDPADFASKGKNTPVGGHRLRGRVIATIYGGSVVYETSGVTAV